MSGASAKNLPTIDRRTARCIDWALAYARSYRGIGRDHHVVAERAFFALAPADQDYANSDGAELITGAAFLAMDGASKAERIRRINDAMTLLGLTAEDLAVRQ